MRRVWRRGEYEISTDPARVDIGLVHDFLAHHSYWAREVPLEVVRRSIEHALPFGLYAPDGQAGFARVVTDYAVFAYLGDVFVQPGTDHGAPRSGARGLPPPLTSRTGPHVLRVRV